MNKPAAQDDLYFFVEKQSPLNAFVIASLDKVAFFLLFLFLIILNVNTNWFDYQIQWFIWVPLLGFSVYKLISYCLYSESPFQNHIISSIADYSFILLAYILAPHHAFPFFILLLIQLFALGFSLPSKFFLLFCGITSFSIAYFQPEVSFVFIYAPFFLYLFVAYFQDQIFNLKRIFFRQSVKISDLKNLNDSILENVQANLFVTDHQGHIVYQNNEAESNMDALIKPKILKKFLVDSPIVFSGKKEISIDQRVYELFGQSFVFREKKLPGHFWMLEDITESYNLRNKLKNQEKLAAVGQLAAGIAHEIRNPLASISGCVELLGEKADPDDQKMHGIILKEVDRLNDLISEFLDYVKPVHLKQDSIHLEPFLNDIIDFTKLNQSLSPDLEVEFSSKISKSIYGDSSKLRQAFLNIIMNAFQALEKTENPKVIIQCEEDLENKHLLVLIKDNGPGIQKDRISRIFEPFHTTKAKGTGLGLAITHRILEEHGVHIDVISDIGKGVEFRLYFPLVKRV